MWSSGAGSDVARAAVLRAKAKVEKAGLDLSYTKVKAPITGRVSRNLVDLGNLVGESEPTLLTKVTRFDPMYAYFNLNERDLLKVMAVNRKEIEKSGCRCALSFFKLTEYIIRCWTFHVQCLTFISFFFDQAGRFFGQQRR